MQVQSVVLLEGKLDFVCGLQGASHGDYGVRTRKQGCGTFSERVTNLIPSTNPHNFPFLLLVLVRQNEPHHMSLTVLLIHCLHAFQLRRFSILTSGR